MCTEFHIEKFYPIQAEVYGPAMDRKDILGRSRTGTGKTLAFLLPIVEQLKRNGEWGNSMLRAAQLIGLRWRCAWHSTLRVCCFYFCRCVLCADAPAGRGQAKVVILEPTRELVV